MSYEITRAVTASTVRPR